MEPSSRFLSVQHDCESPSWYFAHNETGLLCTNPVDVCIDLDLSKMRLYNAQSCTPMGSTSMYVTPKGSPPRKDLPQSPTAFARNWRRQKRQVKSASISSPQKVNRITSSFDPFQENDAIHFPMDPFTKNGGSRSSATSATDRLTPVASSESHELFALSNETDEFLTFSDPFPDRQVDFQYPEEGDLFNDASTWMTSSTLSTKFTNHEVTNVVKKSSFETNGCSRTFAPPAVFGDHPAQSPTDLSDPWPDEVFVRTPNPFQSDFSPRFCSEVVSKSGNEMWSKEPTNLREAFDPFALDPVAGGHMKKHLVRDDFEKENRPLQYLPDNYARPKLRSASSKPIRSLPLATMDTEKQIRANAHRQSMSSPQKRQIQETDKKPGPLQSLATRNNVRSQLDSMLSTRDPLASRSKGWGEVTEGHTGNSHLPSSTTKEEGAKLIVTRLKPSVVQSRPSSQHRLQPKDVVKDKAEEKRKASTIEKRPPTPHDGAFISSAALTSGRARLGKKSPKVPSGIRDLSIAGAPGSFLAERVEAVRPAAVFRANEDSKLQSSPIDQYKQANKNMKIRGFAQGNALQDMLSKRFGGFEKSRAENLPDPPTIADDYIPSTTKPTSESGDKIVLKDDPKFAKYFKMLKMGLPMDAVKNAMERDGMDPSVMDGDHSAPAAFPSKRGIPLKDDPAYAKYFKMLKMGLPMGAVKNAMERDGVDSSVMDGDHSAPVGEQPNGGVAVKDDPNYAKYMKMIKMGLPIGAVKNAMERDGVDSSVMDGDLSAPPGDAKVASCPTKVPKDKYRRTRIHWETHNTIRSNTVWAMVKRDPDVAELNVDEEEFSRLFQAELNKTTVQQSSTGATEKGAVKVIDNKRANNGGITLARIKLSYQEIASAVESYDDSALTQEQIRGLLQYLPTSEERSALRKYLDETSGDIENLCECEKFMVAIMIVKHVKRKLDSILYMQKFASSVEELRRDARLVQKACDEIMASSRLRKILGIVLNLGNRLNTAGPTSKEPANAVTLESLLKLNQLKAFDKKTSFLQYVAGVVRQNNASLCHFKDDLSAVFNAEKILWESTLAELKRMESELESVRRLALYYALETNHASSHGSVNGDSVAAMSIPSRISVEEEIRLLQKTTIGNFTLDACTRMAAVVDEIENAKTSYNALLLYFGEEDNTSAQPNDVFRTISAFSKDFERALTAVVETEKVQLREAKQRPRKRAAVPPQVCNESDDSMGSAEELRVRVSGMGGVLNELRKPNLKWRRRKHVP